MALRTRLAPWRARRRRNLAQEEGRSALAQMKERLRRAEDLFFRVSELAPADRESAIARWCGSDKTLAREVRSLLRHSERMGTFLEEPALGTDFALLPLCEGSA